MKPPSSHYRPEIDGLRAIAIISVLAFHAFPEQIRGGFVGVDIFFVISGFLITGILLRDFSANQFSIITFYSRRIRRIFPALALVLLATLVLGWLLLLAPEFLQLGKHTAAGAGFVSNLVLWAESGYFDSAAETKPLLHLWSLGIEEQFYITHPVLLWLFRKNHRNLRAYIVLAIAASLFWSVYLVHRDATAAFYSPFSRFWELMIGALLASVIYSSPFKDLTQTRHIRLPFLDQYIKAVQDIYNRGAFSWLGLFLIFYSIQNFSKTTAFPGFGALTPTIGTALVIVSPQSTWINRHVLSNQLLVWFGLISFPLYLWHWVLLSFPRIIYGETPTDTVKLLAVATSIVLAWLTFKYIERPLRSGEHAKAKTALLALLVTLIGCAGLIVFWKGGMINRSAAQLVQKHWGDTDHKIFHEFSASHFSLCTPATIRDQALKWEDSVRCLQSRVDLPVDMVLLGDSHAEQLFIGLAENLPRRNIAFYIRGGLPIADEPEFQNILAHLQKERLIRDVIISAYWLHRGVPEQAISATVKMLQEAGKRVAIIDDVPDYLFDPSTCQYDRVFRTNKCSQARIEFETRSEPLFRSVRNLAAENPSLTFISILPYLCDLSNCYMSRQGELLYRDRHHLNINGSRYVGQQLTKHPWFALH